MGIVTDRVNNAFLTENLEALFHYIQRVRREIASLTRSGDGDNKFATMGEQLDGIIEATGEAGDTIIDAAEKNLAAVDRLRQMPTTPEQRAVLQSLSANNNRIFEACEFQDLTGQRVAKIVRSMSYVESRVDALMEIWGRTELEKVLPASEASPSDDDRLMNGPQSRARAISQDEIDKLFD
jgi:chemotaxis protein CheZ